MPRRIIPIEQFKEEIQQWVYIEDCTIAEITRRVSTRLLVPCTTRTVERRLHQWGFSRKNFVKDSAELRLQIAILFQMSYSDKNIVRQLEKDGQEISVFQVAAIRKKLGFVRRMTVWQRERAEEQLVDLVRQELDTGEIEGYGKRLLQAWFRRKGISATREGLFSIIKRLDPKGLERRTADKNRRKGEYIVPGPNYLWSIDGHEKLSPFGFEIYAAIDAYSRCIIWIYVGVSGRVSLCVVRQFLLVVLEKGYIPCVIRSDRGKETPLAAEVHYALARTMQDNPYFKLQDCWYYGSSTDNQRIESWWSGLQKSQLYRWRDYFVSLRDQNQFDLQVLGDQITMLAVYMPIVRHAAIAYKDLWNIHTIRKQPNRPNAVTGQPQVLYDFPPTANGSYGVPINPEYAKKIEEGMEQWDINEYLPRETLLWCEDQLASYGIDLASLSASNVAQDHRGPGERLHVRAYALLRPLVRAHIQSGQEPSLATCLKMDGGYERVAEFGGPLQEVIESNADFVRQGKEIEEQLALEEGIFEEGELEEVIIEED